MSCQQKNTAVSKLPRYGHLVFGWSIVYILLQYHYKDSFVFLYFLYYRLALTYKDQPKAEAA